MNENQNPQMGESAAGMPGEQQTNGELNTLAELQEKLARAEAEIIAANIRAETAEARVTEVERLLLENQEYQYALELAVMEDLAEAEQLHIEAEQLHIKTKEDFGARVEELIATNEDLRTAGERNPKTGLPNRAAFDKAEPEARAAADQQFVLFDGDNFGKINKIEEFGYDEGDRKIRRIAKAIEIAARGYGVSPRRVFHWGGDEFCVISPDKEVEYFERNAAGEMVSLGMMSTGNAILRRAVALYKTHHYVGTKDEEQLDFVNSLSGAVGSTFEEAAKLSQAAKNERKALAEASHKRE